MFCLERRFNGPIPKYLSPKIKTEKGLKNIRLCCELLKQKNWRAKHLKKVLQKDNYAPT
jgi:hypothetical protein